MKSVQHHIRKQFLDFDFATKSAALQWQQKVAFQYQQEYVKMITAVLNKYDDGSCIEIDKMVIDIGIVREDEVALRIGEELEKALKRTSKKSDINSKTEVQQSTSERSTSVGAKSTKNDLLHVFLYFMSQGHFPWYNGFQSIAILEEQLLQQFSISDLVVALKADKVFDQNWQKTRFFYQFSNSFMQEIASQYFKDKYSSLTHIAEFCQAKLKEPIFKTHFASSTKSKIADRVTQWILLFAPENKISWPREFIKWYITKHCLSDLLISNEKVWTAIEDVRSEDRGKVTEGYLKKLLADIQANVEVEMRKSDSTNEKENIDIHHRLDEKNDPENGIAGIKEERKTHKNVQGKDETSQLLEKDAVEKGAGETDAQEPKSKAALKSPRLDDTDATGSIKEEKGHHNDHDNEIERATLHGNSNDKSNDEEVISDISRHVKTPNVSEESIERQFTKSETIEENSSTELSDDSVEAKASFEGSNDQIVFNAVKEAKFYPTIEETIDTLLPPEKDFSKVEQDTSVLPPDSYYINDGGLVLVWPYLSRLFENLKYTKENQFISRRQQERAVLLLGYIATGQPSRGEHELVFSKFLCNWTFQMPVIHPFELTSKERKEVKSMLQGLIAHWSILKNTSIDGLRETFFWREGKLEEKEEHWKLVVEQRGTDILLNHLPYGISMIKLPWHKKMLRVDWA